MAKPVESVEQVITRLQNRVDFLEARHTEHQVLALNTNELRRENGELRDANRRLLQTGGELMAEVEQLRRDLTDGPNRPTRTRERKDLLMAMTKDELRKRCGQFRVSYGPFASRPQLIKALMEATR